MAVTASLTSSVLPNPIDKTQNNLVVYGTIAVSGTYATNGDTLDLSTLGIPSNQLPTMVEIYEVTPAPGPMYGAAFRYLPGTTQANGLLEVWDGTTQITTATWASLTGSITGFALRFRATFPYAL